MGKVGGGGNTGVYCHFIQNSFRFTHNIVL